MGCGPFSGRTCSSSPYAVPNSNPNPERFKIIDEWSQNGFLILLVNYPDAKNYEGNKLLVYRGFISSSMLLAHNRGRLDPHFYQDKGSPIARFRPDAESVELINWMISY